jgi:hypothetical protein
VGSVTFGSNNKPLNTSEPQIVYIDRPMVEERIVEVIREVEKPVIQIQEKIVEVIVEKVVDRIVEKPVDRVIIEYKTVEVPVMYEKIVEKPVEVIRIQEVPSKVIDISKNLEVKKQLRHGSRNRKILILSVAMNLLLIAIILAGK